MTVITLSALRSTETLLCAFWRRQRGFFMRFALSLAAAACGLLLLGVATFGQPDAYLRLAREQWDNLTDTPPPRLSRPSPADAGDGREPGPASTAGVTASRRSCCRRDDAEQARQALACRASPTGSGGTAGPTDAADGSATGGRRTAGGGTAFVAGACPCRGVRHSCSGSQDAAPTPVCYRTTGRAFGPGAS